VVRSGLGPPPDRPRPTLDLYHDLSLRILHIAMSRYPSLTPRLEDVVHEQSVVLEAIGRGGCVGH
jgi:hypothetical protein